MEGSASKLIQVGVGKVWLLSTPLNHDVTVAFLHGKSDVRGSKQESICKIGITDFQDKN